MKSLLPVLFLIFFLSSCKDDKKINPQNSSTNPQVGIEEIDSLNKIPDGSSDIPTKKVRSIPSELQAVFTAHGGLDHWQAMNNLCFEMKGKNGVETHTVSLPDRKTKIESKDWSIGFDGKKVWLLRHDVGYEGDPDFYHDLMFYFYAMPFVVADPATNFEVLPATELDGKMYNGYKVTYNNGVGDSSKDAYNLYFDPQTHKMSWLGYTVSFKNQEKSSEWHFIKYDKWQDVNGLLLPEKLTWYSVENGKPKKKEMDVKFDKIAATETLLNASVFKKPAEGRYVD